VGEGRSRQEDAETSCRPGWAQPKQTPSPSPNQPRAQVLPQVRNYSEWGFIALKGVEQMEMEGSTEGLPPEKNTGFGWCLP